MQNKAFLERFVPRASTVRFRSLRRPMLVAALTAACLLSATLASSAPSPGQPTSVVDNETVYVVADAGGTPRTTVVVDWLQVEGDGTYTITDPAPETAEVESLTDGFEPTKSGDDVVATVDVEGSGDFFYRANSTAPLPLEVKMTYYLDDVETAPTDLAGKSGRLRIVIDLHNTLDRTETVAFEGANGALESSEVTYAVPLLCVPRFEIDGTRMKNIVAPEGAQLAITGSTRTYAVPMVPLPDASATLEMDASDIELAPLVISVFPKLPASADFSIAEDLEQMRDALEQLAQLPAAHVQIVDGIVAGMDGYDLSGAADAADGLAQLSSGLTEMSKGASGLARLADGQYAYLDRVIAGIDTSQFDSLDELVAAITQMRQGAAGLESGAADLVTLLDGQVALLQQLSASNASLLGVARDLAATYPADSNVAALASGLGAQQAMIGALLDGGDLGGGYMPGLRYTRDQLNQIAGGLTRLRQGLEQIEAQSVALLAIPDAFSDLRDALIVLRDGGMVNGQQFPGLDTTRDGLHDLADGLAEAQAGLAGSTEDIGMLEDVPGLLEDLRSTLVALGHGGVVQGVDVPGIDTTAEALGEMSSGLDSGLSEIREGEALTQAMKDAADAYTSFLGSPEGAEGHLGFLFKLDGVSR